MQNRDQEKQGWGVGNTPQDSAGEQLIAQGAWEVEMRAERLG